MELTDEEKETLEKAIKKIIEGYGDCLDKLKDA